MLIASGVSFASRIMSTECAADARVIDDELRLAAKGRALEQRADVAHDVRVAGAERGGALDVADEDQIARIRLVRERPRPRLDALLDDDDRRWIVDLAEIDAEGEFHCAFAKMPNSADCRAKINQKSS